jgi:hypothetical protein
LEELVVLAREIEARKLPFVAVSVGGDGMLFRANADSPRIRLARQARWITLRNGADQVPLRALGVATEVYPDVILQTPTMIRGEPRHAGDRTVRIGIHLYLPRLITWWFRLLVLAAAIVRPEREFVFFETKIGGKPWRSLRPPRWLRRPNVVLYSCIDPARDVGMLRSLDVMISSRLHLGLTGLAYGIPLIAFGAQQKTRVQLQRLKLDAALWPRSHWWRLFRFLGADDPTAQLGPRPQLDLFEKEVVASRAHFDALARWLEELPACHARGGTPTGAPPGG